MFKPQPPIPMNVVSFGNSLCKCNEFKMSSYYALNPMTSVFIMKGEGGLYTETQKETQREETM